MAAMEHTTMAIITMEDIMVDIMVDTMGATEIKDS